MKFRSVYKNFKVVTDFEEGMLLAKAGLLRNAVGDDASWWGDSEEENAKWVWEKGGGSNGNYGVFVE